MSTTLIVGSWALNRALGRKVRFPKDLDVFSPAHQNTAPSGVEIFWHPSFVDWLPEGTGRYATLDELYTLKVSHSYWELKNGSWLKHIEDADLLKQAGAKLLPELHDLLYQVWEEKHGRKRVDLTLEADQFFADAVTRKYDHDSLHASVAYGDEPMYVRFLVPGTTVKMDMDAIRSAPFEDQVRLFREEVYATALERIVVPSNYTASPRAAYAWALRRTITSLTKGWSAKFLVENYGTFRKPDCDYVRRHRENSHRLIPLEV